MYVDIVISNIFYLNKHFFFFFSFLSIPILAVTVVTTDQDVLMLEVISTASSASS